VDSAWDLESVASLIPRLLMAFHRRYARELDDFGLTLPQFLILLTLKQLEGASRMGSLACAAQQSAAATTGIVDRLLERGLVQRERHPEDRRAVVAQLTDEGRHLLAQVKRARAQQWGVVLQHLEPADRQRIPIILTTLLKALEVADDSYHRIN